jgi:hypothetical protein
MKLELNDREAKLILASLDFVTEQNSSYIEEDPDSRKAIKKYNDELDVIFNKIKDEMEKENGEGTC